MALKLVKIESYPGAPEVWHIFKGQRWQPAPPGSRYFQELYIDMKCEDATYPTDPKKKGKIEFAEYQRTKHAKSMCKNCLKKLRAEMPIPTRKLRGFHE